MTYEWIKNARSAMHALIVSGRTALVAVDAARIADEMEDEFNARFDKNNFLRIKEPAEPLRDQSGR